MQGFNKVILAGNLTRDPETRFTQSGTAICQSGLAINRRWKDQDGESKEECTFVDVTLFGKTAELAGQHLRKGNPVLLEGRLQLDQWEDKHTGQKRSKLLVIAEHLTFLPSGQTEIGSDGPDHAERPQQRPQAPQRPQAAPPQRPAPAPQRQQWRGK